MTRPCAAALLLLLGGCELAEITPPGRDDAGPPGNDPRAFFEERVQPGVDAQCALSTCHISDGAEGPRFLDEGSDYDRVLAQPRLDGTGLIVVPGMPEQSAFYDLPSIPNHPLSDWRDNGSVREWILMEADIEPVDAGPMVQPPVVFGPTTPADDTPGRFDLLVDDAVVGEVRFLARINGGSLTLEQVELHARGAGVSITEPWVFVVDGTDRRLAHEFTESANYTAAAAGSVMLATTAALGELPAGATLELEVGTISTL